MQLDYRGAVLHIYTCTGTSSSQAKDYIDSDKQLLILTRLFIIRPKVKSITRLSWGFIPSRDPAFHANRQIISRVRWCIWVLDCDTIIPYYSPCSAMPESGSYLHIHYRIELD